MKTILVPVDGSEHARKAADFAGDLASKFGADIILLHVLEGHEVDDSERRFAEVEHVATEQGGPLPWVANVPAELTAMLQRVAVRADDERILAFISEQVVKEASNALADHGQAPARTLLRDGPVADTILDTAEEVGADLIVMGSRGMGRLQSAMLGSVSQKVAHLAHCTCISVR